MRVLNSAAVRTVALLVLLLMPALALAQQPAPAAAPAAAPPDDPDLDFNASQPDFTIVDLPTTLRLPRFKSAFRVTHRFGRPLGAGDFGDLASDFFALDSGAQIGLEYRFGVMRGLQVGVHRTNDRTIQLFSQYSAMQQNASHPLGIGVLFSVDGADNFSENFAPSIGVDISRELGRWGAVYFEPIYVNNSNPLPDETSTDDNSTMMFGFGARLRIRPTVYVVAEVMPRTGYTPGSTHGTFGIEKRVGGHSFQMNFSDGFGTTMGQLARGGTGSSDWYLGFNISRKFF